MNHGVSSLNDDVARIDMKGCGLPTVILVLSLSACGGGGTEVSVSPVSPTPAPTSSPSPSPAPNPSPATGTPPADSPAATSLNGIKEFHWATREKFDARTYRFTFRFQDPSNCVAKTGNSGQLKGLGYQNFEIMTYGNGTGYTSWAFSTANVASLRLGSQDFGGDPGLNSEFSNVNSYENAIAGGDTTLTFISLGQFPRNQSGFGDYSYAVSVSCDKAFDVVKADWGTEASFRNLEQLSGSSASSPLVGSTATVSDSVATYALNSGIYLTTSAARQAGTLRIVHPAGVVNRILGVDENLNYLPSGAGTYSIELSRVSVFDDFMLASFGLERPVDIQSGMLTKSPF